MTNERRQKSAAEFLSALNDLSLETEEEILAMSRDQLQARLSEEGINLDAAKADLASRLKTIRGQQRLAEARERRLATESAIATRTKRASLTIAQMRAEVNRLLGLLNPSRTPMVQAYFNRFQEATDDDLPGLLEDLLLLDEQQKEGR